MTEEERELARKRASKILDKVMPKRKAIAGPENVERGQKYQELLKEERERIMKEKK